MSETETKGKLELGCNEGFQAGMTDWRVMLFF